jgi:hypothetical protein
MLKKAIESVSELLPGLITLAFLAMLVSLIVAGLVTIVIKLAQDLV